ncbi:MAG TPA: flagellar basal body-associated FliL family protein [Acidimicrobiia bacterium]|nr:flagellar basal body-associated FliL family protein [Acidimicrobiia bacterium]
MAKKSEEAEGEEAEAKKGKKGLIIKIVVLLVVGLVVAKMTVLKPPPPTAAQKKFNEANAEYVLKMTCAVPNQQPLPKAPKPLNNAPTTSTTAPPAEPDPLIGPELDIDSKTLNLAGSHFLKIGVAVQLPPKSVPDDIAKTENWGGLTGQAVIDAFSGKSIDEILPEKTREDLRHQIGYDVCLKSEGKALTVYFTEFVAQ